MVACPFEGETLNILGGGGPEAGGRGWAHWNDSTGTTTLLGPQEGLEDMPLTEVTRKGVGVTKKLSSG